MGDVLARREGGFSVDGPRTKNQLRRYTCLGHQGAGNGRKNKYKGNSAPLFERVFNLTPKFEAWLVQSVNLFVCVTGAGESFYFFGVGFFSLVRGWKVQDGASTQLQQELQYWNGKGLESDEK